MATSGTIRNDFRSGYAVQLVWNVTSQNVANNTSTVNVKVQLVSTGSSYTINSSATKNGSVSINGNTYSFTFNASLSGNQTKTINERTVTIAHASNGTKSCSFGFSVGIAVTLSGTYYGTISKSGTGTFNTIPRASSFDSVSASSSYLNSTITYKYTPKSSSFYNRLKITVGGSALKTINLGTDSASQQTGTLTLSASELATVYNKYPKAVSAILTFVLETYSNSEYTTKVGSSGEKTLKLTFPTSLVPTISSVTVSEAVAGIADKFKGYVQNKSKVKVVTSASGVNGSTISSIKVTVNGVTYTGSTITSGVLTKSGTVSISVKATDSRGRSVTSSKSITVKSYSPPQLNAFTGFRSLSDGTENYEGKALSLKYEYVISVLDNLNDSSYKIEYRTKGASSWTTLYSGTGYNAYNTVVTNEIFSIDHAYDLRMTVTDYFGSDSKIIDVPTAFTLLDFRHTGKGIAIGKVSEKDGFEIGIPAYFSNAETPSSAIVLKANTDLNTIKTSGFYTYSSATRETLLNMPITVGSGGLVVMDMGEAGQKIQIAIKCSVNTEIWERMYYSSTWYAWKKIYNGSGKILWSGAYYMTETHDIALSEKVSEQPSGIVLVFSRYADGKAGDYGFNSFFVSKAFIDAHNGVGSTFTLNSSALFGVMGAKYLYLHDDHIKGHVDNNKSGTSSSGITYNNAGFVLRYVIGV
jgi:hypothetical protein